MNCHHERTQNLLKAAKAVLGINAYNKPTPDELEILHYAIYKFEEGLNYEFEPRPTAEQLDNVEMQNALHFAMLNGECAK